MFCCFFSSRRRHTRCALVTGVQTCALPISRQPLSPLAAPSRERINQAIATGTVRREDGSTQSLPLQAALITRDGKRVYRIEDGVPVLLADEAISRSEEHTSELQSLMRISYAVFCLKKKNTNQEIQTDN